jgi:hypothetical protein
LFGVLTNNQKNDDNHQDENDSSCPYEHDPTSLGIFVAPTDDVVEADMKLCGAIGRIMRRDHP